jgi:hypothetical protein
MSAAVWHERVQYLVRVSYAYEDGWEAMIASGNVAPVRTDYERDGYKTVMLPIALSRDGVSISPADGRSIVPVMAAAQCGATGAWWSPRHMVALSVGAKLSNEAMESDALLRYNAHRLAHAELRTILVRISQALQSVIEGKPTVIILDKDTGDKFIVFPYFAALIVDQPEEATLSSKRRHWCVTCAKLSPLEGMMALMADPLPRWHDPTPQRPDAVMSYVNGIEALLAESVPRLDKMRDREDKASCDIHSVRDPEQSSHYILYLQPIVPLEAFADLITVFPSGDARAGHFGDINVMLRATCTPRDGRRPFSGDPMHLFSLAIKHTMEELSWIVGSQPGAQKVYRELWIASSPEDGDTTGVGGRHKRSMLALPAHHNEPQRYSYFLRAALIASRVRDRTVSQFVEQVMVPLAEAIMEFYSAHDRELGPMVSISSWLHVTDRVLVFSDAYNRFFVEKLRATGDAMHDARFLSHHNLIHSVSAWRRYGSWVITHMGVFEKGHRDARAVSVKTTRQYCDIDQKAQTTQTHALWRIQMAKRLRSDADYGTLRTAKYHTAGGIESTREKTPAVIQLAVCDALAQLRNGGTLVADNGEEIREGGSITFRGMSSLCCVAVHGYALDVYGYRDKTGTVSSIPFLLAAKSVRLRQPCAQRVPDLDSDDEEDDGEAEDEEDEDGDVEIFGRGEGEGEEEGGEEVAGAEARPSSHSVFLFGIAVEVRIDDAVVTVLLGHAPRIPPGELTQRNPIINFKVSRQELERFDHACLIADVGGVLGGLWTPGALGDRIVSTFGMVHPALVAPRRSWVK